MPFALHISIVAQGQQQAPQFVRADNPAPWWRLWRLCASLMGLPVHHCQSRRADSKTERSRLISRSTVAGLTWASRARCQVVISATVTSSGSLCTGNGGSGSPLPSPRSAFRRSASYRLPR